uniref:Uncharacterized protein n=1 Tax=Hyaloperonospora arabidopsidis (strain Emoy2) TaxID=559515 RepID=M4BGN5_HYAAE
MLNKDELRDSVLMVFSNKQDLSNATSAAEMTDKLGLQCLCSTGLSWCIVPRWVTSSMKVWIGSYLFPEETAGSCSMEV